MSHSVLGCVFTDLSAQVSDVNRAGQEGRTKGHREGGQHSVGVESDGGGIGSKVGCWKGGGGQECLLGVSGAVG